MSTLADILATFDVQPTGDGRFTGTSPTDGPGQVVFGGQLLAQSLMAAVKTVPDKQVLSLHTVFARGASSEAPLDIEVDVMNAGRAFGSCSVTIGQAGKVCTRSIVLLHAPDDDLIRHQLDAPEVEGPDGLTGSTHAEWWDIRVTEGADISDPEAIGPPELRVWSRVPGAPDDLATSQALLAYASDGFLIGTAMRPHPGIGQSMAHVSVSTTVLAQTLTFHEPFHAGDWLLLDQHATVAGRGRSHGRAEVFTQDGRMVASFSQENMIRDMPAAHRPADGGKAKF
ncbi:MAG: thioesterase family protein [Actinomycetota bacterium]|nr:thioesterase family protein [Actinomycetota bacterium]